MSTQANFPRSEIGPQNPRMGRFRTIVETPFYANNVTKVDDVATAYNLAVASPGTIVTDMPIFNAEKMGLPRNSKVLIFNDGRITGRTATARRIAGEPGVDIEDLNRKVMEAAYAVRDRKMYHTQAYIGLDPEFMVRAHLLIPEGFENQMFSWMLNFQYITTEYNNMYHESRPIENEGDIFVFADPDWHHPDHPMGLAYFDPSMNCAAILGMRYFGEFKKGTLTLAWAIANRHGYACCHGGMKRYNLPDGRKYVISVFGLSGSGKSTITHNRHHDKYDVTILHDDAFIINTETRSSIALEPTYFDKTADYPLECDATKYLLTMQNVGATLDENCKVVPVTEDLRGGNGRAIKSKLWSPNRVDRINDPVNAIFWIMKDPTLPPILKLTDGAIGAVMGAALATKRSSAENLDADYDATKLVYEPYADPFRAYPLEQDYEKFKYLIEKCNVDCYIINTGFFMDKKVKPSDTLGCIEAVVEGKACFKPWKPLQGIEIMEWPGFIPDMEDEKYLKALKASFIARRNFIASCDVEKDGYNHLPGEALRVVNELIAEVNI
ncbi:MAG: phosphoenolpyruvate carboxykinase (ATP) [Lachnospiraceae bacterium]|nr:phosphoenolpyruvate carboxykinase (ATP) [Lachnospiraceae bacterium]